MKKSSMRQTSKKKITSNKLEQFVMKTFAKREPYSFIITSEIELANPFIHNFIGVTFSGMCGVCASAPFTAGV